MGNLYGSGSGDFETTEGGIIFAISVIGIFYYILNYNLTWEFGIILILCFCLGFLCDLIGVLLHNLLLYIWKILKKIFK